MTPGTNWMNTWLLPAFGTAFLIFMGALCVLLLVKMWRNEINLDSLLMEVNGDASMSRFQLLIFTLIVAVGIFLYIVNNLTLPDIKPSVLTLLGISASTYAVGKGIAYSRVEGVTKPDTTTTVTETTDTPDGTPSTKSPTQ